MDTVETTMELGNEDFGDLFSFPIIDEPGQVVEVTFKRGTRVLRKPMKLGEAPR